VAIDKQLVVSTGPHIRAEEGTRSIMLDVLISLAPASAMAVFLFGWRALALILISVASSMFFEFLWQKLMKKKVRVGDLSAAVTGLLLALVLPVSSPYWLPVVGAAFAIIIVKQLYGGLGKNFMNPALAGRAFLLSWPVLMTKWTVPYAELPIIGNVTAAINSATDAITCATPLSFMKNGTLPNTGLIDMLLGEHAGCLGETSAIVLLLGGLYLVLRKVISPRIPLCFIGTVAIIAYLFPQGNVSSLDWMLYSVLGGGVLLGAIFMATDYTTSPSTPWGQVIFGIGCGLLTMFIRYFGTYAEGVSYAILIMNACSWFIEKASKPRRYGVPFMRKAGKKA